MNHDNQQIITDFYQAFQDLDAERMVSHYSYNVLFRDPAFGPLKAYRAANMWRMLIDSQKEKDFKIKFKNVTENSAEWEAFYTFGDTGRPVHNQILAQFEIQNGKIVNHVDYFNLHHWAKQALGFKGWLFGGTQFFQNKLQARTNYMLQKYEETLKN